MSKPPSEGGEGGEGKKTTRRGSLFERGREEARKLGDKAQELGKKAYDTASAEYAKRTTHTPPKPLEVSAPTTVLTRDEAGQQQMFAAAAAVRFAKEFSGKPFNPKDAEAFYILNATIVREATKGAPHKFIPQLLDNYIAAKHAEFAAQTKPPTPRTATLPPPITRQRSESGDAEAALRKELEAAKAKEARALEQLDALLLKLEEAEREKEELKRQLREQGSSPPSPKAATSDVDPELKKAIRIVIDTDEKFVKYRDNPGTLIDQVVKSAGMIGAGANDPRLPMLVLRESSKVNPKELTTKGMGHVEVTEQTGSKPTEPPPKSAFQLEMESKLAGGGGLRKTKPETPHVLATQPKLTPAQQAKLDMERKKAEKAAREGGGLKQPPPPPTVGGDKKKGGFDPNRG